jgi:threonine dehydratase
MSISPHPRYYDHVRVTQLLSVDVGSTRVWLKDETSQVTGAFKFRGNVNHLLRHPAPRVVTASTGNHGLGLATASRALGRSAIVFVPAETPAVKLDKLVAAGADVIISGRDYDESRKVAVDVATASDQHYVPSFDDPDVIDGHSQLFVESCDQAGVVFDRVYVPVGGGGLLAAATRVWPAMSRELVGVELNLAPALYDSLRAGHRVRLTTAVSGIAEGLVVRLVGDLPFQMAVQAAARVRLVDAAALSQAMRWVWRNARVRVEAAGAAAAAGLLGDLRSADPQRKPPRDVLCVLSGGNVNADLWCDVVEVGRELPVPRPRRLEGT